MLGKQQIEAAINQFHDEGYAIVRNFLPEDELVQLQNKTAELREIALEHPVTYRHGNLTYEILPEEHFGKRYVIQAYWFAWADAYFDKFRSNPRYLQLLEPLIGNNVKQVTQQIHWKPPGARLTGYRFHQDLRFQVMSGGRHRNAASGRLKTESLRCLEKLHSCARTRNCSLILSLITMRPSGSSELACAHDPRYVD